MVDAIPTLLQQILVMFVLMALGFALTRAHLVDDHGSEQISNVVIYAGFPATIVRSFVTPFDAEMLSHAIYTVTIVLILTAIAVVVARLTMGTANPVAEYGIVFSNSGYLGIPLVSSVLGDKYVFCLSVANAALNLLIWTYGVWIMSHDKSQIALKKFLLNPTTLSVFAGLALFFTSATPPEFVMTVLEDVANITTCLTMVVLGCYVASFGIRRVFVQRRLYKTVFVRLVVMPLITIAALLLWRTDDPAVALTVLILMSTPCASLTAMFAQKFGRDLEQGTGLVALSTTLSLVSMPVIISLGALLL